MARDMHGGGDACRSSPPEAGGIAVNARILERPLSGVQRYLTELLARFGDRLGSIRPARPLGSMGAHAWEQLVLPRRTRGALLWSPSNTGPLSVTRQVVTLHDVVPLEHPEWLNARFAAWYRFVTPRLARRVRGVIAISEFTRERLVTLTGVAPERVRVIPNGVDRRFFSTTPEQIERARAALALPASRYVLSLGSLEPRKNLGRLLRAWDAVQQDLPDDVWLVIAGAPGRSQVFRSIDLQEAPARVHLAGRVADELLPGLYAGAMAFAYPSLYEGFGLPPLEAMASGTPVLTGDRTALPEVVGDAGLLVDPEDVEAIGDGLVRLVLQPDLREDLAGRGLQRARRFSWEMTARETLQFLEAVAADDPA
ncbi:MAG TPA: glycosyltransferase family 1 protein [Gammaproteobacteria bacterium]|nr:glycosyltransferase family 1 protein [Gammaproteobacteria bacterium]